MYKYRVNQVIDGPETINKWNNVEYEYNLNNGNLKRKPAHYFPKFNETERVEKSLFALQNYKLK